MNVSDEMRSSVPQEGDHSPRVVIRLRVPLVVLEILVALLVGAACGVLVYRATRLYTSQPAVAPPSVAAPPAVASNQPAVRQIDYQSVNGNPQVTIALDQMVAYDAHRLDHPDRVYIDLHDARLAPEIAGKTVFANSGNLSTIRLAQTQLDTVRIVLDLDKRLDYVVNKQTDPASLVVQLTPAAPVKIRAAAQQPGRTSGPREAPEPQTEQASMISEPPAQQVALPAPQTASGVQAQTAQVPQPPEMKAAQLPEETQSPQDVQVEAPKLDLPQVATLTGPTSPASAETASQNRGEDETTLHQAAKGNRPGVVRNITVSRDNGAVEVHIEGTQLLRPSVTNLSNPERIVIDLANMNLDHHRTIAVNAGDVRNVDVSLYLVNPLITRVVVNLSRSHGYRLLDSGNTLTLRILEVQAETKPIS